MHDVVCVNTARFLEYVWPFYNIMHESVKYVAKSLQWKIGYPGILLFFVRGKCIIPKEITIIIFNRKNKSEHLISLLWFWVFSRQSTFLFKGMNY